MYTKEQILSFPRKKHPYDRIFNRVKKTESGCLEFQGGLDIHGYGKIKINEHNMGTHKVAYILCVGDVPKGMVVMHSCDNPKCVNPSHLSIGTVRDNVIDCVEKGRSPLNRKNKTGYSGVFERKGKFFVKFRFNREDFYLGTFSSLDDAVLARDEKKKELTESNSK